MIVLSKPTIVVDLHISQVKLDKCSSDANRIAHDSYGCSDFILICPVLAELQAYPPNHKSFSHSSPCTTQIFFETQTW